MSGTYRYKYASRCSSMRLYSSFTVFHILISEEY
jgi:hypothetical protein